MYIVYVYYPIGKQRWRRKPTQRQEETEKQSSVTGRRSYSNWYKNQQILDYHQNKVDPMWLLDCHSQDRESRLTICRRQELIFVNYPSYMLTCFSQQMLLQPVPIKINLQRTCIWVPKRRRSWQRHSALNSAVNSADNTSCRDSYCWSSWILRERSEEWSSSCRWSGFATETAATRWNAASAIAMTRMAKSYEHRHRSMAFSIWWAMYNG